MTADLGNYLIAHNHTNGNEWGGDGEPPVGLEVDQRGWPILHAADACDGKNPMTGAGLHDRLPQGLPPRRRRRRVAGRTVKTRNVRDRQLRRWALRTDEVGRRNGVSEDGWDPRGVGYVYPWCVEAYIAGDGAFPRMSTRRYKEAELRNLLQARRRHLTTQ